MALLANELPGAGAGVGVSARFTRQYPDKLLYRNFEGFWTYSQEIIDEIVVTLEDFISTNS